MSARQPKFEEGKVFKEIDYQILVCKERIRNHEASILKAKKMAGLFGPASIGGLDYSKGPSTQLAHIGLDDAARMIDKDNERIDEQKKLLKVLRTRKRSLIKALQILSGTEHQIFYQRFIMKKTQQEAADEIGISKRQLQRIEKQMSL